ncbi:hypothetical protein M5689_018334 [Euphorbia peplus]|nr:hypothetical protein M5689_018334 [Euphorbia peplus]
MHRSELGSISNENVEHYGETSVNVQCNRPRAYGGLYEVFKIHFFRVVVLLRLTTRWGTFPHKVYQVDLMVRPKLAFKYIMGLFVSWALSRGSQAHIPHQ